MSFFLSMIRFIYYLLLLSLLFVSLCFPLLSKQFRKEYPRSLPGLDILFCCTASHCYLQSLKKFPLSSCDMVLQRVSGVAATAPEEFMQSVKNMVSHRSFLWKGLSSASKCQRIFGRFQIQSCCPFLCLRDNQTTEITSYSFSKHEPCYIIVQWCRTTATGARQMSGRSAVIVLNDTATNIRSTVSLQCHIWGEQKRWHQEAVTHCIYHAGTHVDTVVQLLGNSLDAFTNFCLFVPLLYIVQSCVKSSFVMMKLHVSSNWSYTSVLLKLREKILEALYCYWDQLT